MGARSSIGVIVVLAATALVLMSSALGSMQAPDDSRWIVPKALSDAGVHLPSKVTSIDQQLAYQAALPTHQELTVEWRSLESDTSQPMRKEEAENHALRGDFRVLDRKQKVKGGTASRPPMYAPDQL